ncbi:MAG: hypothetical protein H0T76_25420 [Nannocystis sp.]|nr:hypothetical protein [Nannocystis sp.]MBA3549833.1 hypothetical protein [Nannocystis sp.]
MPATIRCSLLAFAWLLTACPWPVWGGCANGMCPDSATTGSTGEWLATVPTTSGELQTVTGNDVSTSSSGAQPETGDIGTTTGEPLAPPAIVEFMLTPNPILANGGIAVIVAAEHADSVLMTLDDGTKDTLKVVEPGLFEGEISIFSGLLHGPHIAHLTPSREVPEGEVLEGETVDAPYEVKLPTPGSPIFWENSEQIGPGQVAALGVLPTGEVIEFGTHYPEGASRCYLRRRNKAGDWNEETDLEPVLPGIDCTAVDMQVDDQGAMFVLVNRQTAEGVRWWMAQVPAWGLGAASLGTGAKDETATALAHHASGMVAVCGFAPTPFADADAMVRLFRPKKAVEALNFDYKPVDAESHELHERVRDCVFLDDSLVLVGEVYGRHALENTKRDRHFVLHLDTAVESATWTVAPKGVKTQSGAQAVDVDDQGRLVVAGYTCDDACQPEGDLRVYDTKDILVWQTSLGAFSSNAAAVQDVAWSPAGYAVVATGGPIGNETEFTVRAYGQKQVGPLWTFTHKNIKVLAMAYALAIGRYGEVYAGGLGADGYPAVAYIGG